LQTAAAWGERPPRRTRDDATASSFHDRRTVCARLGHDGPRRGRVGDVVSATGPLSETLSVRSDAWPREARRGSDGDEKSARSERTPRRVHQRPAGFLEVRRDVAAAPLAVAPLRRRPLIDSATIHLPPVEDHVVLARADKFHVSKIG